VDVCPRCDIRDGEASIAFGGTLRPILGLLRKAAQDELLEVRGTASGAAVWRSLHAPDRPSESP
jgi:hypothetical protein